METKSQDPSPGTAEPRRKAPRQLFQERSRNTWRQIPERSQNRRFKKECRKGSSRWSGSRTSVPTLPRIQEPGAPIQSERCLLQPPVPVRQTPGSEEPGLQGVSGRVLETPIEASGAGTARAASLFCAAVWRCIRGAHEDGDTWRPGLGIDPGVWEDHGARPAGSFCLSVDV